MGSRLTLAHINCAILGQVIEVFEFATGRVNPGETYLVNQMREAIVFLTDLEDRMPVLANTIKAEVPKTREHPSKTDKKWVETFQRIINLLVSSGSDDIDQSFVTEQMIRDYFSDKNSDLQEHVAMYHDTDLMGIEVIEMVGQAVSSREIRKD